MNSSVNLHKPEEKHIPALAKEQSEDQPLVWRNERLACSPSASAQLECLWGAKLRPQCCSYFNSFSMSRISTSWTLHIPCHSAEIEGNLLIIPGWDTGYSIPPLCFCAALLWALSLLRPEPYTRTPGLHRTPVKMPHQEAKMAFICNWVNSGQSETRTEKAPYCVPKPQCRLKAGFEFINSLAFWVLCYKLYKLKATD